MPNIFRRILVVIQGKRDPAFEEGQDDIDKRLNRLNGTNNRKALTDYERAEKRRLHR